MTNIFYDKSENKLLRKVGKEYYYLDNENEAVILDINFERHLIPMSSIIPQIYRKNTEIIPQNFQVETSLRLEFLRKNTGEVPQIFYELTETQLPEINNLRSDIEKLTKKILNKTEQRNTILAVKKLYEEADKSINKQDITRLYEIKKRLRATAGRQFAPAKSEATRKFRRQIKIRLAIASVLSLFVLVGGIWKKYFSDEVIVLTPEVLTSYMVEYKSYKSEWRMKYIYKELLNKELNKSLIVNKIDSLNNVKL
jgi:hypothetical protein